MADPAYMAAFRSEWARRALCVGWRPCWMYRRPAKPPKAIWFNSFTSERAAQRFGELCERQYRREIDERRSQLMAQTRAAGGDAKEKWFEFERGMCQSDLYYLAKFVLGYDRMVFHVHYFMAMSVNDLPKGYRGLREFPRDCFKTTVMTIAFMVQQVLRNANVRILLKSNAEGNASKKLQEAKNHFCMKASMLTTLFPLLTSDKSSLAGSGVLWKCPGSTAVQEDGTFVAAGVGTSKVSQHFDIIIGDDFWDEKSVTSLEVMTKCRKELDNLVYLLTSPAEGRIVFIGTRFAHDDPSSEMLDPESGYHCIVVSGIMPNGRSLFPESLTIEEYARQAKKNLYVFSCQVMLHPTVGDAALRPDWLRFDLTVEEMKRQWKEGKIAVRTVILADAAASCTTKSDYACLLVVMIDNLGRKLIAGGVRERMEPSRFISEVERLNDEWQPEYVVRQNAVLETTLKSFFYELDDRRRVKGKAGIPFYPYSLAKREKKMRITASLQPRLQAGEIYMDPNVPFRKEFLTEMSQHPNSANDDMLDAASELDDPSVSGLPFFRAVPEKVAELAGADLAQSIVAGEALWRRDSARRALGLGKRDLQPRHPGLMYKQ